MGSKERVNDESIERLLREFFAREMPADLRAREDVDEAVARPAAAVRRGGRGWRVAAGAAALVVCGVTAVTVGRLGEWGSASRETASESPTPGLDGDQDEPVAPALERGAAGGDVPLIVGSGGAPTSGGQLPEGREPRVDVRLIGEGAEPRRGYTLPEGIRVEVLPVDGEPVEPQLEPEGPVNPRLPEEGRRETP